MNGLDATAASYAALIEVMNALGVFREHIVIVGGWVPDLLYPMSGHSGSIDVDLAIAPEAANANAYQSMIERLTDAGYSHHSSPTRFTKPILGTRRFVKVDLICGQYQSAEKAGSMQLGELQIGTLRGIDLAFEQSDYIEISGQMPNGALNAVKAKIVRAEAFILMKAFAMD